MTADPRALKDSRLQAGHLQGMEGRGGKEGERDGEGEEREREMGEGENCLKRI